MRQFTLRQIFLVVSAVAVVAAAEFHPVAIFIVSLVCLGLFGYSRLTPNYRVWIRSGTSIVALLIGVSPFLDGSQPYGIWMSGRVEPLPTWDFVWGRALFEPLHKLGEWILMCVGGFSVLLFPENPLSDAIFFTDSAKVRPFSLSVIWLGMATALGATLVIDIGRRYLAKSRSKTGGN